MQTTHNRLKLFVGLLLGLLPAWSEAKVSQELTTGVQSVDLNQPEAKFEEYDQRPDGMVIDRYAIEGEGDHSDYSFQAKKVRQEDQSADLAVRLGKFSLDARYDQTPHHWSTISQTLYRETAPGVLTLPDSMQATVQAQTSSGNTTLDRNNWFSVLQSTFLGLAATQPLETRQDQVGVGLGYSLSEGWTTQLRFSREKKEGHRLQAFGFGRNYATELAKPVDQTVYESKLGMDYVGRFFNAGLSYGLSLFQNDIESLTWDSTKRASDRYTGVAGAVSEGNDSARGQASMQPDNQAHAVALTLGLQLPLKSRLSADVSYTKMLQNQELLPYTINSAINTTSVAGINAYDRSSLPQSRAGAEQTLIVQNYQFSLRPFSPLGLGTRVLSEQLANTSDEIAFAGHAQMDNGWQSRSTSDADTSRFQYRKLTVGANLDYTAFRGFVFSADAAREKTTRDHREYKKNVEDILTQKISFRTFPGLSLQGRYVHADRKAEEFEEADYLNLAGSAYAELPGLRRSDIAARRRDAGDLSLTGVGGPLSLTLSGGLTRDKYRSGEGALINTLLSVAANDHAAMYGLLESRSSRAGADLSLDLSDRLDLFSFYQFEKVRGIQRSNTSGGGAATQNSSEDWTSVATDRYDTVGIGLNIEVAPRLTAVLGYDLAYSQGATDYRDLGSLLSTKKTPPQTKTTKQDYSIKGEYKAKDNLGLELGYLFEKYTISDYATENIPLLAGQSASQTNVLLGDSIMDYKAHVVSAKMNYKW